MYYELYIDIFFLENFMIDSILLLLVRIVFGKPIFTGRIFTAGAVGAALSCVVVAGKLPKEVKNICFYFIIPLIMLLLGIKISGVLQLLESVLLLYFAAICVAGFMQLFKPYVRTGSLIYGSAIGGYWGCRIIWQLLIRQSRIQKQCCQVVLYEGKKRWHIQAMIDTGNMLQDPVEHKPIHIISKRIAEKMYGQRIVEELLTYSLSTENEQKWVEKKIHYIPCQTIQGTYLLPVMTMEKMEIKGSGTIEIQKPQIGISIVEKLSEHKDYQMIVNAQSIGGSKNGCRNNEHTTV